MDEISDQMHKLSRELDALDEDCTKYQVKKKNKKKTREENRVEKLRADCQENIESYSVLFNLSNSLVHPQYESVGLPFCATISELSYIVFVVRSAQFSEIIVVVFFSIFRVWQMNITDSKT